MSSEAVNARTIYIDEFGCNIHTRRSQGGSKKQHNKDVIQLSASPLVRTLDLSIMKGGQRKESQQILSGNIV